MEFDHDGHDLHEHEDHEIDPHIWTSPARVKFLVQNVFEYLRKIDPEHEKYYTFRVQNAQDVLEKTERQINEAVIHMPPKSRSFIVFHPSYGYFAKDYKLKQYAIEVNGKEPKPKDLAKLIQMGRKNNVKIVFVQPQFSKRAATTIAKDLGATIVETDPLSADLMGNIQKLVSALKEVGKK